MFLERPLTNAELQEVASLDVLTDAQIVVVAAIRPYNRIAPLVYAKAVIPAAEHADVIASAREGRVQGPRCRCEDCQAPLARNSAEDSYCSKRFTLR